MFKNIIVKKPGKSVVAGLSSAGLGAPDYEEACAQHRAYIEVMESCGVKATILEAEEEYPDSCFVEDPAIVTEKVAIITNPGAPSRKGEVRDIKRALEVFYTDFEYIKDPGTLEGGDILRIENHFYIGLSDRTNEEGARQLIAILERHGYTGSVVKLNEMLHLKTGVNYIGDNTVLVAGEFIDHPEFRKFNKIIIDEDEMYAANCIRMNDYVVMPSIYFPKTKAKLEKAGFKIKETPTREYEKIDGGLSCLSLRF